MFLIMLMVPLALVVMGVATAADNNDLFKSIVGKVAKLKTSRDDTRTTKKTRRVRMNQGQ